MSKKAKEEQVKEESLDQTVEVEEVSTEEVVEETPEKTDLELANERAEEFENKYLRAHAEMQNIQRRANEERQNLQRYRSQDLAKKILPSLDNLERALAVEGLTDDVKKDLKWFKKVSFKPLKKRVSKKLLWKVLITICTWQFKPCQLMMNTQQIALQKSFKRDINCMRDF